MNLGDMRQALAERHIRLTRSLGQNFLHDGNQLRRMVAAAGLAVTDRVLEIGPGLGPLTERLVAAAGHVQAIEKDRRLFEFLSQRWSAEPKLVLVHDDALDYLRREARDWSGWKVVANLPYSVASPLLVQLAGSHRAPDRLVATLQLEVGRRLLAGAGTADYGVLTLLVRLRYEPRAWFRVSAGCFFPEPAVDSACVTLVRRDQPLVPTAAEGTFVRLVKRGFSQRRKMLFKLLKTDWPEPALRRGFDQCGLSLEVRAEAVEESRWATLARVLSEPGPGLGFESHE